MKVIFLIKYLASLWNMSYCNWVAEWGRIMFHLDFKYLKMHSSLCLNWTASNTPQCGFLFCKIVWHKSVLVLVSINSNTANHHLCLLKCDYLWPFSGFLSLLACQVQYPGGFITEAFISHLFLIQVSSKKSMLAFFHCREEKYEPWIPIQMSRSLQMALAKVCYSCWFACM